MQQAAIVPNRERPRLPMQTAGELGPGRMMKEEGQECSRLLLRHAIEALRVDGVHEERLATTERVHANDGMHHFTIRRGIVARHHDGSAHRCIRTWAFGSVGPTRLDGRQPAQHLLHSR